MARWDSPAKLRRMGRDAFAPGEDPDMLSPFKGSGIFATRWNAEQCAMHWRDGWDEGAAYYEWARKPCTHVLYKTGDADAPNSIVRDGEVVLDLCRLCGKAECELDE